MRLIRWAAIAAVVYVAWQVWKVKQAAPGFSWAGSFDRWRAGF
jgi:hypothetical protein